MRGRNECRTGESRPVLIIVLKLDGKLKKFILEGLKCMRWVTINNTNDEMFAR